MMAVVAVVLALVLAGTLVVVWPMYKDAATTAAPPPTGSLPPEPTVYDIDMAGCINDIASNLDTAAVESKRPSLEAIAAGVAEVRALEFERDVETKLLSPQELGRTALEHLVDHPSTRRTVKEGEILVALGLVPPKTDVSKVANDIVTTQLAGFYLPREEKIFAVRRGRAISSSDEIVLAHEFQHALADQRFGLPNFDRLEREEDSASAALAVIEGDAQLTSIAYARAKMAPDRLAEAVEEAQAQLSNAFESRIPYFFEQWLKFPYNEGALFACHLYESGGWEAIDAAYKDLPKSTLEILFPHRYGNSFFAPVDPKDPRTPSGWKKWEKHSFGAADLLFMIRAPGGEPTNPVPDHLGMIWGFGGGEVTAWTKGSGTAVALTMVDRPPNAASGYSGLCDWMAYWVPQAYDEARELAASEPYRAWAARGRNIVLGCDGDLVRVVVAPRLDTAAEAATLSPSTAASAKALVSGTPARDDRKAAVARIDGSWRATHTVVRTDLTAPGFNDVGDVITATWNIRYNCDEGVCDASVDRVQNDGSVVKQQLRYVGGGYSYSGEERLNGNPVCTVNGVTYPTELIEQFRRGRLEVTRYEMHKGVPIATELRGWRTLTGEHVGAAAEAGCTDWTIRDQGVLVRID